MRKVIRIMDRLNIGGPSIHVMLLSQLDKTQFTSTLITGNICEEEGDMSYLAKEYNVSPLYVNELGRDINLKKDLVALWKIYRIMRKEKPFIVHTHKSKAGFLGRMAAILAGVPVIIHTFHGHVFHGYFSPQKTRVFLFIERFLARFCKKIITISEEQFQELRYKFRIAHSTKFQIVPLGFRFTPIAEVKKQQNWLRKTYNWNNDDIIIGIIGRLAVIKNHQMFFKAVHLVLQKRQNIKIAVIGDGEEKEKLLALVEELGIENQVLFTGWITDTAKIYSDLDIVALTSLNEGTPVVLIEAMYYQIPVVATKVGGVPDVVNKESGFLSSVDDIESFCENLIRLIDNPDLRKTMGQDAHLSVKEKYSHTRLLRDIENLYHSF